MIACVLVWTEPQEGSEVILFEDSAMGDLVKVKAFVDDECGDEVGCSIARMDLHEKTINQLYRDDVAGSWEDLALNIRYSSGEELYENDCPVFKGLGIERS